jgi:ribosome-dependent ATPase
VSFRIRRGEIFGFVGPNGCGKTTTMKMLTGLLPVSAGRARLFGKPIDARDLATRRRVGFMSQSFSLYTELTVRQNLDLHARLFHLPRERIGPRVAELVEGFGLADHLDHTAETVPLGVRQRLSLAVAVIHEPEMLILDEPTSGVDPAARDRFWALLADLSRNRGVTIFLSTHFMNEAERCDRISLMHAGRVLAEGAPAEIVKAAGAANLEEAFIAHLTASAPLSRGVPSEARQGVLQDAEPPPGALTLAAPLDRGARNRRFSLRRLWAYARREATELRRDPIRLSFALLGPILLMVVFGFGITFDVERLAYAALDADRSPESRRYLEDFATSRYFEQRRPPANPAELERRLRAGELRLGIEVPAGFGRDLRRGRAPEVAVWLDGAFPFRAQTSRGYVEGVHGAFVDELARGTGQPPPRLPAEVEVRFRYNQEFLSVYAVVPSVLMVLLMLIPAVMTAVGVVREKELGSITNLYVTPTTGLEFLLGKQLPYVGVALLNFASLLALAVLLFGVPLKGSLAGLVLGAALYVAATTAFGLVVSSFVRTQIAAIFAAAILASLPTIQYSGFLMPVSSMSPDAQAIGRLFPAMHFQHVSVGTFTKGLGLADVAGDFAALALILVGLLAAARLALRTQEA